MNSLCLATVWRGPGISHLCTCGSARGVSPSSKPRLASRGLVVCDRVGRSLLVIKVPARSSIRVPVLLEDSLGDMAGGAAELPGLLLRQACPLRSYTKASPLLKGLLKASEPR
jgi:hypothetical protein